MKDELREKCKIKRRYFAGIRREEADRAISEIFAIAFGDRESFFIYNSGGTEADTKQIIAALCQEGKRVYLPRTEGDKIVPVPYETGAALKAGAFGISEPQGEAYEGEAEVTVVPLLAINKKGYRLGYGGGYYDRYLKSADTLKVGIGYYFQMTDELMPDEWDEPLDFFICERGIFRFEH